MPAAQNNTMPAANEDDRDLFRLQFKKTRVCSFYLEGRCARGKQCTFSHGQVETTPDLTKTSLCKRFMASTCGLSSAKCPFAHGKHELRRTALYQSEKKSGGKKNQNARALGTITPSCSDVPMPSKFQINTNPVGVDQGKLAFEDWIQLAMKSDVPMPSKCQIGTNTVAADQGKLISAMKDAMQSEPRKASPYFPASSGPPIDLWEAEMEIWDADTGPGDSSSDDDRSPSSDGSQEPAFISETASFFPYSPGPIVRVPLRF